MNKVSSFKKATNPKQVKGVAQMAHLEPGDPRYVSLDDIRGDNIRKELKRCFLESDEQNWQPAHILYAGHRGNGKTTELFAFMDEMKDKNYCFVYKQAYTDLARRDLDYTDLMLYLARMAVEGVCQQGIAVDNALLQPIENWFAKKTRTEKESYQGTLTLENQKAVENQEEVDFDIPGLLKLLTSLNSKITGGHESVLETRSTLQNQPSDLIRHLNELFNHLRTTLEKSNQSTQLVLIVDNLDRHPPVIMDNAFSQWASLFQQLQVHLIITVPLGLIYDPQGDRMPDWEFEPLIVPMPKIRLKEHAWEEYWEDGVTTLTKVIQARVEEEKVFAGDKDTRQTAMRELVLASGGSLRELLRLLAKSALEAWDEWDEPITFEHVQRGIRKLRQEFTSPLRFADVPILHKIHRLKRADPSPEVARQLFFRFALEYNGEQWADVHPLVYTSDLYNIEELYK